MTEGTFLLKVRQVASVCSFELNWGQGQVILAQVPYPETLWSAYQRWQQAYLAYYRQLRGRVVKRFQAQTPLSRQRQTLVEAESRWLTMFHQWLQSRELVPIQQRLMQAGYRRSHDGQWVEMFLACSPNALARFPWETWPLGELTNIRIARMPENIAAQPVRSLRRRVRVLAIMGDDTGLGTDSEEAHTDAFAVDRQALEQFSQTCRAIEVLHCFYPYPQEPFDTLLQRLCQTITQTPGWDILCFAGHSQENALGGGQLRLAPHITISLNEIAAALVQAQRQGLQFAIFNSCDGLDIADGLVNLGLSQVVVMREPIHHRVAQVFLQSFLQHLAQHEDGHTAVIGACADLQRAHASQGLAYPSAALVPSIFRHPAAQGFRIAPFGLQRWRWNRAELITLGLTLGLSLIPGVQDRLLEWRVGTQARYRQVTQQLGNGNRPAVLLVKIDEASRRQAPDRIKTIRPINYDYLADLVTTLTRLDVPQIGIDYILDDPTQADADSQLSQAIRQGIEQGQVFVFAVTPTAGAEATIAQPAWSLTGDITFFPGYLELPPAPTPDTDPLAYQMALIHHLQQASDHPLALFSDLASPAPLRQRLWAAVETADHPEVRWLARQRLSGLTTWAHQWQQMWLHPIIDFSLPPEHVYESISAFQLLAGQVPAKIEQQSVLIVPWQYEESGVEVPGADNFPLPMATRMWRGTTEGTTQPGGESHAYMLHHFLERHRVTPIPSSWMILVAVIMGKATALSLQSAAQRHKRIVTLVVGNIIGMGVAWQVYITFQVLIPYFLPLIVFWSYVYFALATAKTKA
jgi:hypothetical protein